MNRNRHGDPRLASDVAIIRRSLGQNSQGVSAPARPFLVVLSGLPGTGKSYFARQLARRLPLAVVGSDRSRKALIADPKYTREEHIRVFSACHQVIEELLKQGRIVVFDATNLTEGFRQPLLNIARDQGIPILIILFTAPLKIVRQRLQDRAGRLDADDYSDADWSVFSRLRPGQEPIRDQHWVVDSSGDIRDALDRAVALIQSSPIDGSFPQPR